MIWIALYLIVVAGIAEHYKDLSEEGKLSGYWGKNQKPLRLYSIRRNPKFPFLRERVWEEELTPFGQQLWWKVHWLQGGLWDKIPVWIRQYLAFRDGWHLLKFISLNSFAIAVVLLAELPWWWYIIIRSAFSLPETILREARKFI